MGSISTLARYEPPSSCQQCVHREACIAARIMSYSHYGAGIKAHRFNPHQHVFHAGSQQAALYLVKSGAFKSYSLNQKGEQQVTGFYLPGDVMGLDGLADKRHESSVIALQTSSACIIPLVQLEAILERVAPPWLIQFAKEKLKQAAINLSLSGKRNAKARIATFLLNTARNNQALGCSTTDFYLSMSRDDIGNYLGLASETVSRTLARMQEQGLLKLDRRHVTLVDTEHLYELAEINQPEGSPYD